MGLLKLLLGTRTKVDDDFSFRDRDAAVLGDSKQREEDADTVEEMRRETGDQDA